MPIRPELRKFYTKIWRTETRPRILLRAQNRCEFCQVLNHASILRAGGHWTPLDERAEIFAWWFLNPDPKPPEVYWTDHNGAIERHRFPRGICRAVTVVLTIAHLNHTPGDDRDENLKALCQWCHLNYDKDHRRVTRSERKDQARPLFENIGRNRWPLALKKSTR